MMGSDPTTDPKLRSWVTVADDSDFPIQNLPLGVFQNARREAHVCVAIGEYALDLHAAAHAGLLEGACERWMLLEPTLNALFGAGRATLRTLRERIVSLLRAEGDASLRERGADTFLVRRRDAEMRLPLDIGDYVDFYSSLEHATNLGRLFRPDGDPLLPNWRWIPIGYHGRSGTIVVDGTPIVRPAGQRKPPGSPVPVFGPTAMLDIELEVGFFTGKPNAMGAPIAVNDALDHIAGVVLVNDWSARDIQSWEYQPLGPFLGKSFATTISPWVVTLDALAPFRVEGPLQEPAPLEYLQSDASASFEIDLAVDLRTAGMRER